MKETFQSGLEDRVGHSRAASNQGRVFSKFEEFGGARSSRPEQRGNGLEGRVPW